MIYDTIEFFTHDGNRMTIEAADVRAATEDEEIRYRDGGRLLHDDSAYEITKTWTDDAGSYMKVWLLKIGQVDPPRSEKPRKQEDA
jgi:hypothetical protein